MRSLDLKFAVVLLGIFSAGVCLIHYVPSGLFPAIGEALIIASVLGGTVDFYLKRHLSHEVSKDISRFLLGYPLPEEIQKEINSLMQTHLLRRDMQLRYEVKPAEDGNCLVNVEMSYYLENFTKTEQKHTQMLQFERTEFVRVLELRLDSDDKKAAYVYRQADRLELCDIEGVLTVKGKPVKIEPADSRKKYKFGARYELICPTTYSDIFSFGLATSRATLKIINDGSFEVSVDNDPSAESTGDNIEFRRMFLPSQHIRIRWKPTVPGAVR